MSMFKGKGEGHAAPIEEPQALQEILRGLLESDNEFSIKVEGTSTLPYAARLQGLDFPGGACVFRLVRPLPHELATGATFRMTFAVEEQRFEGLVSLEGREAYLQYRFRLPPSLLQADRRRYPRFPFRPRENAYVIAQDGGIPGLGVAGPLVNISQGGLALRVDRALRLDDGMRLPVGSALFERGKGFPRFRVQDLPLMHLLEGRAMVAHATERGTELILGLSFLGLEAEAAAALARTLEFREKMHRGQQPGRPEGAAAPVRPEAPRNAPDALELPADPAAALGAPETVTVPDRLRRRAARTVLVMPDGPVRRDLQAQLRRHGFRRLEVVASLAELEPLCAPGQRRARPALVLVDLALAPAGDLEPLAAARILESRLAALGRPPAAILCEEVDPTLLLAPEPTTRFLPYAGIPEDRWAAVLDGLLPVT